MQTISLVSQKGGSGKTTLAIHVAAEAVRHGHKVLLIDLDPQASAALWADRRPTGGPDVSTEHPARLEAALQAAKDQGYEFVVLDTAPHFDQAALRAAKASDLILVPCRPATFDLGAVRATLEICELAKKPATFIINHAPIRSRVVDEAREEIVRYGGEVSPTVVRQRVAFQHCLIDGRVAAEFEPGGLAAEEISDLCKHVGLFDRKPTYK
jgi:chromosome partitioning protein